ncbi:hypothetical protein [Kitasatospora sp. GAS204B]|uniref:hypothetical protein n=1 Tax=unclassified Kitasatospora TaxID=2633591 RepID=UPI002473B7D0|nr:hypothetical protein [Kitasatospora sp. GAS204B]
MLDELHGLGRLLQAAAVDGAAVDVLDPLLADMRQVHEGIVDHLAAELSLPRRRAVPAPLLARSLARRRCSS